MRKGLSALVIVACTGLVVGPGLTAFGEEDAPKLPPLGSPFEMPKPESERNNQATNLGDAINSPFSDFGPIICPDGNQLYFTSDRTGGMGGQDVWVSERVGGEWKPAKNLGPPINTAGDEGPDSFSISENALYFTACDREFGHGGCDIYVSFKLSDGKWSLPENLGEPVNSSHNESNASISSDGDFIIFTSDRPGGQGGADLWMAKRGEMIKKLMPGFSTAGRWEEPVNLGESVNTADWEGVGFLMPDNQTLYFSSRGRGGAGADVFRSVRKEDTWSPAQNMGDIINTSRDDIYFTLPGSGDLAYFSSDMAGGKGMEDIYSIPIPLLIPKSRLVVVRGSVEDAETGAPVKAMVKVIDPATDRVLATVETNPGSGDFQVIVQIDRVQLDVQNSEHKPHQEMVEIESDQAMAMVKREIKLNPK